MAEESAFETTEDGAKLSSSRERLEVPPPQEKSSIGRVRRNNDFIFITRQSYHRDDISVMTIWEDLCFSELF